MPIKRLIETLARNRGGLALLAGLTALLAGVDRLLSVRGSTKPAEPANISRRRRTATVRTDYFRISLTQSDLGYAYWVLHGYGRFASFTLFDTWREAMDEANTRIASTVVRREVPKAQYASA